MSGRRLAVVSAILAALAVVLFLLAVDVGRWRTSFVRDDVRFKALPMRADLWKPNTTIPFAAAQHLLGVGDDLRYRHVLRAFLLGRPDANAFAGPGLERFRSEAMITLSDYVGQTHDHARRGQAANLLGVMGLALSTNDDPAQRRRFLLFSANAFRDALDSDPSNDDAKYNLEVTLRLLRKQPGGQTAASPREPGRAGDAALTQPGSGY